MYVMYVKYHIYWTHLSVAYKSDAVFTSVLVHQVTCYTYQLQYKHHMQIKDPYLFLVSFRLKCQHRQKWIADIHTHRTRQS